MKKLNPDEWIQLRWKFSYDYPNYLVLRELRKKELLVLASLNTNYQSPMINDYIEVLEFQVRIKREMKYLKSTEQ